MHIAIHNPTKLSGVPKCRGGVFDMTNLSGVPKGRGVFGMNNTVLILDYKTVPQRYTTQEEAFLIETQNLKHTNSV